MKRLIISLVFVFAVLPMMAGGNITLEIADNFFSRLAYNKAAPYYEKYVKKHEDDAVVWQKLAKCYEMTNSYDQLVTAMQLIMGLDAELEPQTYLSYGNVLQVIGKPAEAIEWFEKYLEKYPEDRRAANQLEACRADHALLESEIIRYEISNMEFNTALREYGPNIFNNTLLYTSTGEEENTGNKIYQWTGANYSDIRQYERGKEDVFIFFNQMEKVNTRYNDGIFTVDPINERFYYTRNNYNPYKSFNKKGLNSEDHMNLKIYVAENDLGKIEDVEEFAYNDAEYNTAHPTISADGNYLVFVSDKPHAEAGGRDLYYCSRSDEGWSVPVFLTTEINTEGDEIFPTFHEDGSLFFSSDGLGSMGGLDIFRAELDFENNKLIDLERLRSDINSTYDDFGIVFDNRREGYFTSDRPDGKGEDDIYSFKDLQRVLRGIVVNEETGEIIPNADVVVKSDGVNYLNAKTDEEARFKTYIYDGKIYDLDADTDYFYEASEIVNTNKYHGHSDIDVILELIPVKYSVKVIDAETNKVIPGANVDISFGCDEKSAHVTTSMAGTHRIPVHKNCQYNIKAKTSGYLAKNETWKSPSEDKDEIITIYLDKVTYAPIALRNIYYDFDKDNIRLSESSEDLDMLLGFLRDNPELTIRINSHTDARGSNAYNANLSQRRAQSVVNYLKARYVKAERLHSLGYGEDSPINNCSDGVKCSEEEHQMNRRTEFQVVNPDGTTKIASDAREDIKTDPCTNCSF